MRGLLSGNDFKLFLWKSKFTKKMRVKKKMIIKKALMSVGLFPDWCFCLNLYGSSIIIFFHCVVWYVLSHVFLFDGDLLENKVVHFALFKRRWDESNLDFM